MTTTEPTDPQDDPPPSDDTPDPAPDADPAPDEPEQGNHEAAKWRHKLRAAEAERDTLAERLTAMQRAEAERLAGAQLSAADDLWRLGDVDVTALLDDDGHLDPERVTATVAAVLKSRPQLAKDWRPGPKPDPSQGSGRGDGGASWQTVLGGDKP